MGISCNNFQKFDVQVTRSSSYYIKDFDIIFFQKYSINYFQKYQLFTNNNMNFGVFLNMWKKNYANYSENTAKLKNYGIY